MAAFFLADRIADVPHRECSIDDGTNDASDNSLPLANALQYNAVLVSSPRHVLGLCVIVIRQLARQSARCDDGKTFSTFL